MKEILIIIKGGLYYNCYSNEKLKVTVVDLDYLDPEETRKNIQIETTVNFPSSVENTIDLLLTEEEL